MGILPTEARVSAAGALPIVVTHGMGDSCFNQGMEQITTLAGSHKGVYSVCIPGGDSQTADTLSAFFTTMNDNVDIFARKVRADPKLAGGFDAFGLSQGNSVLRGYIQKYNNPPVRHYLSIHGTGMGVSGFPNCNPVGIIPGICDTIADAMGDMAYTRLIQDSLFQANYFRDPWRTNTTEYLKFSQIAQWNNEHVFNQTLKDNFVKVASYSMIKALKDTMVFPNEGEWWGEFPQGTFNKTVETLTQTPFYIHDLFGLKTVDQAKKFAFETTPGEHLQFTQKELTGWLDKYFI